MLRKIILPVFLIVFFAQTNFAQQYRFKLKEANGEARASSTGKTKLEFINYSIKELYSVVTGIPENRINTQGEIDRPGYSLTINAKRDTIDDKTLKTEFIAFMDRNFIISTVEQEYDMLDLSFDKVSQRFFCEEENTSEGYTKKINRINKTWKGYCVTVNDLSDILTDWYEMPVNIHLDENKTFNIVINHLTPDLLSQELSVDYDIQLNVIKTQLNQYTISKK